MPNYDQNDVQNDDDDQNDVQNDDDDQNDADEIESSSSEQPTDFLDKEALYLSLNDIKRLTGGLLRADAGFTEADRDETKATIRKQQGTGANADANLHQGAPDGPP